jgi:bifunctional DNA-binding transcriptional regulator/antitoxin component of YhaV-PrlF toxin-antitoxin module
MKKRPEIPLIIGDIRTIDSKGRTVLHPELRDEIGARLGGKINLIAWDGAIIIRSLPDDVAE